LSEKNRARYLSFYDTLISVIQAGVSGNGYRNLKNDRSRKPGFSVRLEKIIEQTSRGNKRKFWPRSQRFPELTHCVMASFLSGSRGRMAGELWKRKKSAIRND
jgi:hypothetical protein